MSHWAVPRVRLAAPGCGSLRICDRFVLMLTFIMIVHVIIIIIIMRIYNENRMKFSQIGGKRTNVREFLQESQLKSLPRWAALQRINHVH